MQTVTRDLARYVCRLGAADLDPRARLAARIGMTDCIATMIAGRREAAPVAVAALLSPQSGNNPGALCLVDGRRLSPSDAALANGTAGHVLDYDDVALAGHPSAVLAPAILALGAAIGCPGGTALVAYAAGYEVWAALQAAQPGQMHDAGLHPTAVLGAVAAAAACSVVLGTDEAETANALAISASMASGLTANFGTMTKSFQVGRAAQTGVMAAQLGRSGFDGAPDVFEHPRGFLTAMAPVRGSGVAPVVLSGTARLARTGVNIKQYPTCYATHRSIDAMLDLVTTHDLTPEDVGEVRVTIGETQHRMLRNPAPSTGLEARFSIEFALSAALVARQVGLAQMQDDFVRRDDVQGQFRKVRIRTTAERMVGDETFAPSDIVAIVTADGRLLQHEPVSHARGSWQRPLSEDELAAKFRDCTTGAMTGDAASRLLSALTGVADLPSLAAIPFDFRIPTNRRAR